MTFRIQVSKSALPVTNYSSWRSDGVILHASDDLVPGWHEPGETLSPLRTIQALGSDAFCAPRNP